VGSNPTFSAEIPRLSGKELSLIRMVKWVQSPYSVQYRVVGQLVGRLIWDEDIVQVRVLSTLLNSGYGGVRSSLPALDAGDRWFESSYPDTMSS
jgi:hypothetical protein